MDRRHLRRSRSLHVQSGVAEQTFDPQALLRKKLAPPLTDKKRNVSPALGQAAAKIAAGAACSEHQDSRVAHGFAPRAGA